MPASGVLLLGAGTYLAYKKQPNVRRNTFSECSWSHIATKTHKYPGI